MANFKLKITQEYLAARSIVLDVEADDLESAVENLESGAEETPSFDDPRWKTSWDLQDELVDLAAPEDLLP